MTVSTLNPYSKQALDFRGVSTEKSQSLKNNNSALNIGAQSKKNELISNDEKTFFVRLFPESAEKISRHTLFDNAGKSISANVRKGMIIDAKV